MFLCYVTFRVATNRTGAWEAILLDGALICVILFFRAVKAIENALRGPLRVTNAKAFANPRATHGSELQWGLILLLVYTVCVLGACLVY